MPHHKSAKKRVRQTESRTAENKAKVSAARSSIKAARLAVEKKDKDAASKLLVQIQSQLDTLAKRGVIKSNNASRRVGRLAKQVAKL